MEYANEEQEKENGEILCAARMERGREGGSYVDKGKLVLIVFYGLLVNLQLYFLWITLHTYIQYTSDM